MKSQAVCGDGARHAGRVGRAEASRASRRAARCAKLPGVRALARSRTGCRRGAAARRGGSWALLQVRSRRPERRGRRPRRAFPTLARTRSGSKGFSQARRRAEPPPAPTERSYHAASGAATIRYRPSAPCERSPTRARRAPDSLSWSARSRRRRVRSRRRAVRPEREGRGARPLEDLPARRGARAAGRPDGRRRAAPPPGCPRRRAAHGAWARRPRRSGRRATARRSAAASCSRDALAARVPRGARALPDRARLRRRPADRGEARPGAALPVRVRDRPRRPHDGGRALHRPLHAHRAHRRRRQRRDAEPRRPPRPSPASASRRVRAASSS